MIVAFIGYKQSGKSTASKYLQEKHGFISHNFKDGMIQEMKYHFPDFLKAECELYNCDVDYLFEKKPGHIRQLMQNFGTELRRREDLDYWTNAWQNNIKAGKIVVDDCRFLNEAQAIKELGGIIIKIIKTGQQTPDSHRSETEYNQITPDYIIEAEPGDKEKIYMELDRILLTELN